MSLTQKDLKSAVNFINIQRTNFSHERWFGSFFYVHVTREKCPRIMLMKLTPGVNFINILIAAFMLVGPKSAK